MTKDTEALREALEQVKQLAQRDMARTQTDFIGRMGQELCDFEAAIEPYPDGELPDDVRGDAYDAISGLAGLAFAQMLMLRGCDHTIFATPASDPDTIGSHYGNGGGLDPVAGEVAPVGDYHVTSAQYEAAVKGRQDFRQAYREQLNLLSQKEWAAVAQIGADQELSTSAVLRQAVRLYQMHLYRLKAGETLSWSGDEQRAKDFAGPLYAHPPHPAPVDPAGGEALREALKDMARGVFIDAATQTHHSWVDGTNGREPDFDEAAGDYAEGFADAYADNILAALKGPAA